MGQKTHPIGLRVGIHRKWNFTWYATDKSYKKQFFQQNQIETFFKTIFHFYPYTKVSRIKKVLLIDLKFFRYGIEEFAVFIFFYKFRKRHQKKNNFFQKKEKTSGWSSNIKIKTKFNSLKNKKTLLKKKSNFTF